MVNAVKKSRLLAVFLWLCASLWIISFSISVPILNKWYYYLQIEPLHIVEDSGYDRATIVDAYRHTVNYCIGLEDEFHPGVLGFSESGASHFADCKKLFLLDLWIALITSVVLVIYWIFRKKISPHVKPLAGRNPFFWAGITVLVLFGVVGGLGSIDFDRTFVVFHQLFFPGKTNWLFDPAVDQVINILPEQFFMNCAILIVVLILALSILMMVLNRRPQVKKLS